MMARTELTFVGYGGQGIITMAQLLAKGALIYEGNEVAQTEAYGAAARGGSCWAEVIISDEKINYPRAILSDYLIVLTQSAANEFKKNVKPEGGIIFTDPTTVRKFRAKKTQTVYEIPAIRIAREEFNMPVVANVIMFGAIVAITKILSRDAARKTVESSVPPKAKEINLKAIEKGFQIADELLSKPQSE
jgi:2-oxoglutarate ferredoxin oxidoreductase subunit gamma